MMDIKPIDTSEASPEGRVPTLREIVVLADSLEDEKRGFFSAKWNESGPLVFDIREHGSIYGFDNVVTVGNSGLLVVYQDGFMVQHFMPDDRVYRSKENSMKYSLIYAASILEVCKWAETNPNVDFIYGT